MTITTRKQHHPKEGEESSTTQKRGKWEPPLHLTSLDFTLLQFDLMTSCSLYFISFQFTHEKGDGSNTNKDRGTQRAKGPLYLTLTFTFVLTSISLHSLTHRSHRWILQCFLARGSSRRRLSHRRCHPQCATRSRRLSSETLYRKRIHTLTVLESLVGLIFVWHGIRLQRATRTAPRPPIFTSGDRCDWRWLSVQHNRLHAHLDARPAIPWCATISSSCEASGRAWTTPPLFSHWSDNIFSTTDAVLQFLSPAIPRSHLHRQLTFSEALTSSQEHRPPVRIQQI